MNFFAITWDPSLGIDLGFFTIRWYSLMFVAAFIFGLRIMKKIYIEDKKLIINDECGTKFSLETIHCSKMKETQGQCFNSKFIINVFKKNLDTFCIVHMKKDFPICFEFSDKRIFIAPLM